MQIGEAKISALVVAGLTGVALTLTLKEALRSWTTAMSIAVPAAAVLGVVMFLMASDDIKKKGGDEKPPKGK
jgi:dihydrodipicolinate synthase/N-acetylneuraminate lyase